MNARFIVPITVILLSAASIVHAQQPAGGMHPPMEQLEPLFQKMDQMMNQAQKAHGAQRRELLREHMRMMDEQMAAAHRMMARMRGTGRLAPAPGSPMESLQDRLDIMQSLMEQMLKQQKLMLETPDH